MTDLSKGIIEINGFSITPETTQDEFEKANVNCFLKKVNKYNNNISTYYYNDYVGLFSDYDPTKHTSFHLNGITFVNLVLDFENGKIKGAQLYSNLQSYEINNDGKKIYSPQKEEECYHTLNNWAKSNWGEPNNDARLSVCWNYPWGCFRPTPVSAHGSDTSIFLVEYGRSYVL